MCHDVSCQALLDEPTSGLDEEAEAHLFSSLQSSCAAFLSIGRLNWAMFFIDAMAAEYVCMCVSYSHSIQGITLLCDNSTPTSCVL